MRVLVVGATGNLGSRLLSALLLRGHVVFAFVRDPAKLAQGSRTQISGIEHGDAKEAAEIKAAVTRNQCDAIVNTAGLAAMAPWGKSDLPVIVDAVINAALEAGQERGSPLRVWFLGGLGLLDIPAQKYMIVDYLRMFPEHRWTWRKLRALPRGSLAWSILCPGFMHPLSEDTYPLAAGASADNLAAMVSVPPDWSLKFQGIPLLGGYLNVISQASAYGTALEDNADFIAKDLLDGHDSQWVHQKIGVKERAKQL
ncbi:uncharacterized protein N7459_006703 [Penicillium hispanicum]|uniref:uncharacterized protein n=1 Tax=Penicillium hispanicum TaxID=1080232 RepID=UPI00254222E1|nr:uncharacterized protein N7459_006703 [Penicillium hispanicum]KAJ5577739.1 hypothetical protein N7459_006703 [Penicillium hispanicum]